MVTTYKTLTIADLLEHRLDLINAMRKDAGVPELEAAEVPALIQCAREKLRLEREIARKDQEIQEAIERKDRQLAEYDQKIVAVNEKIKAADERAETAHRRGIIRELTACEYPGIPPKLLKSEPWMKEMTACSDVPALREKLSEFESIFAKSPGLLSYSLKNGRH